MVLAVLLLLMMVLLEILLTPLMIPLAFMMLSLLLLWNVCDGVLSMALCRSCAMEGNTSSTPS